MATLVGNGVGGIGVYWLGVPHIFFIPLAASGLALTTFIGLNRIAASHAASSDPLASA